jgi:glutamate-1-semialdehyde 2,1-aminomutase
VLPFPYGDPAALGQLFDDHRGKVAAVILEPLRSEMPPAGYLEGVRALCREHGAVLIFDEVTSGFRLRVGGAQEYLGVTPDLAVFAKAISNGYPMAAVVGRREVMEPSGRMFISSTYWSDTIGLRAALTTIRELRKRDVPTYLHELGVRIQRRLNEVAAETGLPVHCGGLSIHPSLQFETADPALRAKLSTLYIQEMAKRGCHGYTSFYLNAAQGDAEVEQTVTAAREVFTLMQEGLTRGTLDRLIECDLQQDAFRRLVR